MVKVLVTGATGFIGNHVISSLLRKGCTVVATSVSETKASQQDWYSRVKYIPFDLANLDDAENYFEFFDRPDILIHLAWEGLPNYKEDFHITQNLPRHRAFISNLVNHGLKDISVTGTCFEYGMKEGCLSEDMVCEPANPYALAKDMLRKELAEIAARENVYFKWIRLFYMYGTGQSPKSLISQLDKALAEGETEFNMSGGQQVRDFLPIGKVAEYIVDIALQNNVTGIINCCSGVPVTVEEFVKNYLDKQHKKIRLNLGYYPYADYEPMGFWGDNGKLKKIIS